MIDDILHMVLRSTWSLQEAAHLLLERHPVTHAVELSPTSSDPISRLYYWLKKEYEKERLKPNATQDGEPRFSPGTFIRHMNIRGRRCSAAVVKLYDAANGNYGDASVFANSREVYRAAAKLVWRQHPNLSKTQMAKVLLALPTLFQDRYLAPVGAETIRRNYLNDMGSSKRGRRSKDEVASTDDVDLKTIVAELEEIGLPQFT